MAQNLTATTIFLALSGGLLPSLLWLWFWLKEDKRPEPRAILFRVFLAGMLAVPLAIVFEYLIMLYAGLPENSVWLLLIWAFTEEVLKYGAAQKTALSKRSFDEPIDAVIYMITAALGFASVENALFMVKTFSDGGMLSGLDVGSMRFLGATLLHIASSTVIGIFIAFSFRKKKWRHESALIGLAAAGLLHFAFNYLIMGSEGGDILIILMALWLIIIALIFAFEKVKKI